MSIHLTLVIPGLLQGIPGWQQHTDLLPEAPGLTRLLSRAQVLPTSQGQATRLLCQLCNIRVPDERDVPMAALGLWHDGGDPEQHYWLRADPVVFQADRDCVWIQSLAKAPLTPTAAQALAQTCASILQEDGHTLIATHPSRWYLRLSKPPELNTQSLLDACGSRADTVMPTGTDAKRWRQLLNELQMALFQHPVNAQRESEGLPAVNSLWFWGGGVCPGPTGMPWQHIIGDDPYVAGLAKLGACEYHALSSGVASLGDLQGQVLVVLPDVKEINPEQSYEGWIAYWQALEQQWFTPLVDMLQAQQVVQIAVYPGSGVCYRVSPKQRFQFWKRHKPLATFLTP